MRVDGVDVRDARPEALWRRIGLVPQRPYLFTGTVASNLRYGDPDATDERAVGRRCEIAQARDFVEAMPEGLDAPIAQGGTNVSGGQRQRLCDRPGARAQARDLPVRRLVLGARPRAPTRGCGPRCGRAPRDATVIIVAQRVSTITDADQIVVLEDGGIVGVGTHEELLESCPTYAEIVESQLAAEEAA